MRHFRPRRRPTTHQTGAVAAELVIVLPLFLAFLVAGVSFGLAYFDKQGLDASAREAARYGATLRTGDPGGTETSGEPTSGWLDRVASVATSKVDGWEHVCVAYTGLIGRSPTSQRGTYTLRQTSGETAVRNLDGTGEPCLDDGLGADDRRVQVRISAPAGISAFFFSRTISMEGGSVAAFENVYTTIGSG